MYEEEIEEMMFCKICKEHYLVRRLGRSEVCKCKKEIENKLSVMLGEIFEPFISGLPSKLKDDSEAINKYLKGKKL
jgi:hypothetical protein